MAEGPQQDPYGRPEFAPFVAVQRVHESLDEAVCLAGNDISIAVEQDIEVR